MALIYSLHVEHLRLQMETVAFASPLFNTASTSVANGFQKGTETFTFASGLAFRETRWWEEQSPVKESNDSFVSLSVHRVGD